MSAATSAEVERLVSEVEAVRARVLECAASIDESLRVRRPADGAWSVAEIVEHLVLAEDFGMRGLWAAVEGARGLAGEGRDGSSAGVELESMGRSIDEVFLSLDLPGRADAPDAVVPERAGRPTPYWAARLRAHGLLLAELARAMTDVGPRAVVMPHFLAGPLDGVQRLQFFRWHLERHLGQMERTIEALSR